MSIKIAFNGFGRMGRLALRAAWDWPDVEIVHSRDAKQHIATKREMAFRCCHECRDLPDGT